MGSLVEYHPQDGFPGGIGRAVQEPSPTGELISDAEANLRMLLARD